MKKFYILSVIGFSSLSFAQTIDFKGCINLFENQNYTFTKTAVDASGKKIYITTPVDGEQPCGGLGSCEFKLQWNDTAKRWEFLADSGNGDFVNPYLIYYSSGGNIVASNPPNIETGKWIENIEVTEGACGGNLSDANAVFTGDLQTSTLTANDSHHFKISVYPNPATEFINISGYKTINSIRILSLDGRKISEFKSTGKIDVSKLSKGTYLLEIETDQSVIQHIKIIKN